MNEIFHMSDFNRMEPLLIPRELQRMSSTKQLQNVSFPRMQENILWAPRKGACTVKAGLPARATGANLLPELKYINKCSAYRENRLEKVSAGNTLGPVFLIGLFIPVSEPRVNLLENSLVYLK